MEATLVEGGINYVSHKLGLEKNRVVSVLKLLRVEQCTVPFVARYRKEVTGNMDEVAIRDIGDSYTEYEEREKRRNSILETLKKMEVLTPELEKKILAAETLNQLEDLYAPYKSKRKTKAQIAKENGLEPYSKMLLDGDKTVAEMEKLFKPLEKVATFAEALEGAKDIVIEEMAHHPEIKETLREWYWKDARIVSSKRAKADEQKDAHKFQDFFEFDEALSSIKLEKNSHRFLALRRGMTEKVLKVEIVFEEGRAQNLIEKTFNGKGGAHKAFEIIADCVKKAYAVYIHPSLDLEMKTELKTFGDQAAINVFSVNLRNLLLSPYLGSKAIMGVDPGVRTGCKVVLIDHTGKFLVDFVIYPHEPFRKVAEARKLIETALEKFKIEHIAIGNGTFGRETLEFIEEEIEAVKEGKVKATMISESGASIYSASDIARKEFPDKDVTVRGAVSIARRFQDPLAELVKIDPKSIGVGQYQHDVNQSKLKKSLEEVVESCVNYVGVDLNTASAPLLSYVSGIGPKVAENIVAYREKKGGFKKRDELLSVGRFTQKVFVQAAGFLRIYQGENPLDGTFIHPERYETLKTWCEGKGLSFQDLLQEENIKKLEQDNVLREELGEHTFRDIVKSLKAPSQDPRDTFKSVEYSKKLKKFEDVIEGEWYQGVVTNITKFGAFVDIGIKENGLVHVSEMADHFVENPLDAVKVGEEVKVKVIGIDRARKRISLSRKKGAGGANGGGGERVSNPAGRNQNGKGRERRGQQDNRTFKNNAFGALAGLKVHK